MSEDILLIKKYNLLQKLIILSIGMSSVVIGSLVSKPFILLSENQILYLMSTMAQVVSGLFGLVLAAYAIIDPKLKAEGDDDDAKKESLYALRKQYFEDIIFLTVICIMTLSLCLDVRC